jgi:hypothetical protein
MPEMCQFLTHASQQNASCDMPATFGLPSTADMTLRRENWRHAPRIDLRARACRARRRRALMRELWNLFGEAVEAPQSVVDVDEVAAIPDALDGWWIPVEFRPDGSVVTIQPGLGII